MCKTTKVQKQRRGQYILHDASPISHGAPVVMIAALRTLDLRQNEGVHHAGYGPKGAHPSLEPQPLILRSGAAPLFGPCARAQLRERACQHANVQHAVQHPEEKEDGSADAVHPGVQGEVKRAGESHACRAQQAADEDAEVPFSDLPRLLRLRARSEQLLAARIDGQERHRCLEAAKVKPERENRRGRVCAARSADSWDDE